MANQMPFKSSGGNVGDRAPLMALEVSRGKKFKSFKKPKGRVKSALSRELERPGT